MTGLVFDVKRFAVHDGPGLRTTVFLKGCPLSCQGCHNPEGQLGGPELLLRPERCTRCGDCLAVCPGGALSPDDAVGIRVDRERCRLTGACVAACLPGALEIAGRRVEVEDLVEQVERDRPFFEVSGGGVTVSGGEPLAQPAFLEAFLRSCRSRGIPVVLDTCGYAPPEVFRALAPLVDTFLYDLKLLDEERHRVFTGVSNLWILTNLRYLAERGADVTVRIPLVPGVNDDRENLRATAAFLASLPVLPPVEILPYHRLGEAKYGRLGRGYPLEGTVRPDAEGVDGAAAILADAGLRVTVRGGARVPD